MENDALEEEILSVFQKEKYLDEPLTDTYHKNQYNSLVKWMDMGEIVVPRLQIANKLEEIQQYSMLKDMAINTELYNNTQQRERVAESYIREDLLIRAGINTLKKPRNPNQELINNEQHCYDAQKLCSTGGDALNEAPGRLLNKKQQD